MGSLESADDGVGVYAADSVGLTCRIQNMTGFLPDVQAVAVHLGCVPRPYPGGVFPANLRSRWLGLQPTATFNALAIGDGGTYRATTWDAPLP